MLPQPVRLRPSRRRFLRRVAAAGGLTIAAPDAWLARIAAQAPPECDGAPAGDLVRTLPLYGAGGSEVPLGQMFGGGLDARLYTDLSGLGPGTLITPTPEVFVRTAPPPARSFEAAMWSIALGPQDQARDLAVTAAALAADVQPMGTHVIECSGNANPQNFGLMSAAAWDGVPLARVMDRLPRPADAAGVLVAGVDHATAESPQSLPGASWVLPIEAMARTGAFLALRMNGQPLTAEHGAPVRLVVPGWYGCAWIKWVNELRWVGAAERSTTQMLEFAFRTHQQGIPELARDYAEPAIDTAAMPVRVEQRRVAGRLEYRVVGIVWGGSAPVDRLVIRFGARDPGSTFPICPAPQTHHTWSLWSYRWRPVEPGYYDIALRTADSAVRTRRLDLSFYIRRVRIDEI